MNYIDTKAKCRHLKKFTCKGTFRQMFIRVYRVEGRRPQTGKHLPPSPFTLQVNFLDDDILLWCLFSQLENGGSRQKLHVQYFEANISDTAADGTAKKRSITQR
jgi:hypothetical protein